MEKNLQQINTYKYKINAFIGKSFIRLLEFIISLFVKDEIYSDVSNFEWVKKIEDDFKLIQNEYQLFNTMKNKPLDICEISAEQYKVVKKNEWDFIPLYSYGVKIDLYRPLFPETCRLLETIPNMTTAFFSILKPGTFIKEHRGAYKGYLRYQLGVKVPIEYNLCAIKIQDKEYHWKEGQSVIFDDTFLHSAWNRSSEERVVLYVDFIRPMPNFLVFISKLLTKFIYTSPFIQNMIKNIEKQNSKDIS
jgi:aspartyl/asparaginyl beta-hydroxylase (cupin superfamily)